MNRSKLLTTCLLTAIAIAGCGGTDTVPDSAEQTAAPAGGSSTPSARTSPAGGGNVDVTRLEAERQRLREQLVIYFEFDQSDIRSEFNQMLAAHGQYLASNSNAEVRLEGHADERGSREYNIGLGEQRAQAVRRVLLLQGASGGQLNTVSYGEERPAAVGSDEESYGLNRRVELIY